MKKKKIGDITLREAYEICNKQRHCWNCPLRSKKEMDYIVCFVDSLQLIHGALRDEYETEVEVEE